MIKIKNIAIIAHVDHGKTTLVDAILAQSGIFGKHRANVERVMDSDDIEKERGITIFSKNASFEYNDYKVNIVDTPGHADFGGEVQRILKMVDSVLLVVDAFEGPMPQTKYVLKKALEEGHCPIVFVNKIDRENSRAEEVVNMIFDLFVELNATDMQLDFPIIYGSAKFGISKYEIEDKNENIVPLLDTIIKHVESPEGELGKPFQMLVSSIGYDEYVGKIGTGKINNGFIKVGQEVIQIKKDGTHINGKISKIIGYNGLDKIDLKMGTVGDIISIAGIKEIAVGETIACNVTPNALPIIEIDQPTLSMMFSVNSSPFSGQDGKFLTSTQIYKRLLKELQSNVSMEVEQTETSDTFLVKGRGELQFSILIENMRREGFELQVSKPKVIFKRVDGKLFEPVELALVDVPEQFVGVVIEKFGLRKGELINMIQGQDSYTRLEFKVPSRGLIGFRGEFLTETKGSGILNSSFLEYAKHYGDINSRQRGVLIATEPGTSTPYAIANIQKRGKVFIESGIKIYEGMVIGENSKDGDLIINPCKEKHLTNTRASGTDESVKIVAPILFSLEKALEYIEDDELLEITPKFVRMRKKVLKTAERRRANRKSLDI